MKNKEKRKIHFVGIGGIGMSALAQYYLSEGWDVSGSDLTKSDITDLLKKGGVKIVLQHQKSKIKNQNDPKQTASQFNGASNAKLKHYIKSSDLIVHTSAVPEDDFQVEYARKLGKKVLTYSEALGELTRKYKTICVSGTHGKSTTTAMLALIMIKAGLDPTVIIGTKLKEFKGTNFRKGKSEWLLIEADEYNASFLNYSPRMIVLTNIDKDHMDYYKDMSHILDVYSEYIKKLPRGGVLVFNGDDKNIWRCLQNKKPND